MTTTETNEQLDACKHLKKKQRSKHPTDIGAPKVPVRQLSNKHEPELLCDWNNAS
ncbi:hypothetical protein G7B40_000995 [Aetokthonos hydrillicola Thurmond2011]|jgi:hypothetical protein|uniref:Uncharacterized protein n=1 Tax=Aetokthonos hydrillicola Thurmond2011 TaxID=2712845 RepID=A0AAP5I1U0_9CYAN|nr:hypothetical protein [Aetokthonos hydrillicola]MBW4589561.1 hypothetical protein [Aetokthonos hydrillicola CCALA 1050]MDR9893161.1 hypothetical protein [Aetokthonos hydrillicola Thurmond2011]